MKKFMQEMRTPGSFWRDRILICLAVLLSYASIWPNRFVVDDLLLIKDNAFFKTPDGLFKIFTHLNAAGAGWHVGFYRPVPMAIQFFIYQISSPLHALFHIPMTLGFHALDIALQALNGCLLFAFGIRAGFNRYAALAAALLWAVHPLHTEAVTYMAAATEPVWSMFCLLGLITLLPKGAPVDGVIDQTAAFTPRKIKLSLLLFTLALLSKESAIVFPALATATLFFISPARGRLSTYFKTWPLWLLSFAYILIILFFIITPENGPLNPAYVHIYKSSIAVRVWTALGTLPTYARLMLWPAGLHYRRMASVFTQPWHGPVLLGGAMVAAALLQILWGRAARGLGLTFGLVWFAAAQSPNTGIVTPINAVIAEHMMYLPTMGLFLGVAHSLSGLFRNRTKTARMLVATAAVALGTATFRHNMVWRNTDTLYRNTEQNGGSLIFMNIYESAFLLQHHRFADARLLLQKACAALPANETGVKSWMQERIGLAWLHVVPRNKKRDTLAALRKALPHAQHIDKAIASFEDAARLDPAHSAWQHKFLAAIYAYQGNTGKAAEQEKSARHIKPKSE